MSQRPQSQLQVEYLEDRCTPSTSPFSSLFAQLEAKFAAAFPQVTLPSFPSLPSHPSLPTLPKSLPSFPSLPSFSSLSVPKPPQVSLPQFPSFPQFPQQFESQLSNALQSAKTALEHLHSQVDALFSQLSDKFKDQFPWA